MISDSNGVQLFGVKMGPPLLTREWETMLAHLPDEDRMSVLKYKHWQDRQRALLGNVLVRWLIRRSTSMQHVQIARNDTGRPYLTGNHSWEGDFNVSHSGEWVVAALVNRGRVGVDVEKIDRLNEDVMTYAMTETEVKVINQRADAARIATFYELWTMKEAIYKTGLFPNATPQSLDTLELRSKRKDIFTHLLYVDRQHPVSICWDREQSPVTLTVLDREQLT